MRSTGNTKSNQLYNPNNKPPPTISLGGDDASESIEIERYIRDKYERKSLMKPRKPPPPSPTFTRDSQTVNAILGPPARSPSLGSSGSSANLKPGQRASQESFERARSPASTNSSVEAPPPKPLRPATSSTTGTVSSNPFLQPGDHAWMPGPTNVQPLMNPSPSALKPVEVFSFPPPPAATVAPPQQSPNPFQPVQTFLPQQSQPIPPQPTPQVNPFASQSSPNPFLQPTPQPNIVPQVTPQQTESMPPQITSSLWDSLTPPAQPNFQFPPPLQSSSINPLPRASTFPPSANSGTEPQNPFAMRSSSQYVNPTNPFAASPPPMQSPQIISPFNSVQPSVPQSPFTSMQQSAVPPPQQQQQQPMFQPLYPPQQQVYQPLQPFSSNQSSAGYPSPRMDKQSILNLFNAPPAFVQPQQHQPPLRSENFQPQWTQQ